MGKINPALAQTRRYKTSVIFLYTIQQKSIGKSYQAIQVAITLFCHATRHSRLVCRRQGCRMQGQLCGALNVDWSRQDPCLELILKADKLSAPKFQSIFWLVNWYPLLCSSFALPSAGTQAVTAFFCFKSRLAARDSHP